MKLIIGALVVIGSILGGYLPHGSFAVLIQPLEVLIICGGAFGAFIIANPASVIKGGFAAVVKILKPDPYNKERYLELIGFLFSILNKARREGLMSLESDVEDPKSSALFEKFPSISKDHHATDFICDYLRLMIGGSMNSYEIENLMDLEMEAHHKEAHKIPHALFEVSQALPGFGIIAAVLGIIVTMGYLDQSAMEIGGHVAAALVGTMLGLFVAYGFVGPTSNMVSHLLDSEAAYYQVIKTTIIANLNGYAPAIAVEFGRKAIPPGVRPGFQEVEEHLQSIK
jgi:chemotaxis protein MotA